MNLYRVIDSDGYVLRIVKSKNEAMHLKDLDKNIKIEIVKCSREKVKGTYEWAYQTVGECRL
jgi:hypothetical protein